MSFSRYQMTRISVLQNIQVTLALAQCIFSHIFQSTILLFALAKNSLFWEGKNKDYIKFDYHFFFLIFRPQSEFFLFSTLTLSKYTIQNKYPINTTVITVCYIILWHASVCSNPECGSLEFPSICYAIAQWYFNFFFKYVFIFLHWIFLTKLSLNSLCQWIILFKLFKIHGHAYFDCFLAKLSSILCASE